MTTTGRVVAEWNERAFAVTRRFGSPSEGGPLFSDRYAMAAMPVAAQYFHWAVMRRLTRPRLLWPIWRFYRRLVVKPLSHRRLLA